MLVDLKSLLEEASKSKYAVGAFNVTTLENIQAIITAAEALNSPVILQYAQVHEDIISIEEIGPIMLDYAKRARIPVAVHLDHGSDFEMCIKAIRLGFTSIMYDASSKDFETNLRETKEIVKVAHAVGVSVEAELGHVFTSEVGGGEGRGIADSIEDYEDINSIYTDPQMALEFVEKTDIDCLAIAFGTTHGIYFNEPVLDLDRVKEIKDLINIPLVMHGGSGVSNENYKIAIKNGISKINFYTYMNRRGGTAIQEHIKSKENEIVFLDELSLVAKKEMTKEITKAITVFKGL